jgi:hypothetical protein
LAKARLLLNPLQWLIWRRESLVAARDFYFSEAVGVFRNHSASRILAQKISF